MMGNAFYPDEWLDSAYDIPYEQFYQKGMRGIIFDIDNTLVPHGAPADERAAQLKAQGEEMVARVHFRKKKTDPKRFRRARRSR